MTQLESEGDEREASVMNEQSRVNSSNTSTAEGGHR